MTDPLDNDCSTIDWLDTVSDSQRIEFLTNLYPTNPWITNVTEASPAYGYVPKRPASDDQNQNLQRPQKALRGEYETQKPSVPDEGDDNIDVQCLIDSIVINGKHHCTCGRSYTAQGSLKRHVDSSGGAQYPCLTCGKKFGRRDLLRRHDQVEHKRKGVACPGCKQYFRPDYWARHLASPRRESCRQLAEALDLDVNGLSIDVLPAADDFWIPNVAERLSHGREDRVSPQDLDSTFKLLGERAHGLAVTLQHYNGLRMRPILRANGEPCALCGLPLGSNEKEVIDHIQVHSLELSTETYTCEDCQIDFKFAADLQLHLDSAAMGYCGFKFVHHWHNATCYGSGHHPPSKPKVSHDDHDRMQAMVSVWQDRQLRAHRVAIARLQAELLLYGQDLRHSLGGDELMCRGLFSRLSIGSIHSFQSVPAWLQYQQNMGKTGSDVALEMLRTPHRLGNTSLAANSLSCSHNASSADSTPNNPQNDYLKQVKAVRGPGGLKSGASRVRYRAKATKRYLLGEKSASESSCRMSYVHAPTA